jgi:hypothetical protein
MADRDGRSPAVNATTVLFVLLFWVSHHYLFASRARVDRRVVAEPPIPAIHLLESSCLWRSQDGCGGASVYGVLGKKVAYACLYAPTYDRSIPAALA